MKKISLVNVNSVVQQYWFPEKNIREFVKFIKPSSYRLAFEVWKLYQQPLTTICYQNFTRDVNSVSERELTGFKRFAAETAISPRRNRYRGATTSGAAQTDKYRLSTGEQPPVAVGRRSFASISATGREKIPQREISAGGGHW